MYAVVSQYDGRYLQLRGGYDWGYTEAENWATEFGAREEAEAAATRCQVSRPLVVDLLDDKRPKY